MLSGVEGRVFRGEFKFPAGLTEVDFVDLAVGLREDIPVKNFSAFSHRFGNSLPLGPNLDEGSGKLSMTVTPSAEGNMLFLRNHGNDLSVPVEIFCPSAFPFIAAKHIKMRDKSFFEPILTPSGSNKSMISFSLDLEQKMSISKLSTILNLAANHAGDTVQTAVLGAAKLTFSRCNFNPAGNMVHWIR